MQNRKNIKQKGQPVKVGPFVNLRQPRENARRVKSGTYNEDRFGYLNAKNKVRKFRILFENSLQVDKKLEKVHASLLVFLKNWLSEMNSFVRDFPPLPVIQEDRSFSRFGNICRINSGFPNDFCKLHFKFAPPKNRFTILR